MENSVPGIGVRRPSDAIPPAISRSSFSVARPSVTAWRAIAESVMRSAHSPPHHARSSGVAKHHNEAPGSTSSKPAACAHAKRNRPASGSPALRRAILRYSAQPAVDRGLVGVPAEGAVITVARRDQPARLAHSLHFAQRGNGIGEMLEHLMRVHDVKRGVVRVEGVEVADRELDVRTTAGVAARLLDDGGRRIDAENTSGRNPPADVSRDRARPAPEVEHADAGCEVRGEVSGGVVDGTPLVRPQDAFVVTVRVGQWFPK